MGENTAIEWAHHTFNPWRGCAKVSPGCANCYAEATSKRNPKVLGEWGPNGKRVIAAEAYWKKPEAWDRAAKRSGERHRVFCASLADVFEDRHELHEPRARLFTLIQRTPNLDWLLLTKRPENIMPMLLDLRHGADPDLPVWDMLPLSNLWFGTSVEDQAAADERIPELLNVPAVVRFLSCEPLLGQVDLTRIPSACGRRRRNALKSTWDGISRISWVIVGGESGPRARPMHPDWARSLRGQCFEAGAAFHFKQWGEWAPDCLCGRREPCLSIPRPKPGVVGCVFRCGKKAAGRELDGRTWDGLPEVRP